MFDLSRLSLGFILDQSGASHASELYERECDKYPMTNELLRIQSQNLIEFAEGYEIKVEKYHPKIVKGDGNDAREDLYLFAERVFRQIQTKREMEGREDKRERKFV